MNKDAPSVQADDTAVYATLRPWHLLGAGLVVFIACAHRGALSHDELYRRIQVFEARIAKGSFMVRNATTCKKAHAPAEREVCDPSAALCELTDGLKDTDAIRRCVLSSDACRAARERARALCATPPGS